MSDLKIVASNTLDDVMRHGLVYLATPYSKYARGLDMACHDACIVVARLMRCGLHVYSPIAHSHTVARADKCLDPRDHSIWIPVNEAMMRRCDVLLVAKMEGWDKSFGVTEEISWYRAHGKPIYYLDLATFYVTRDFAEAA